MFRKLLTFLYSCYLHAKRRGWALSGKRKETVFGHRLQIYPRTEFPSFRGFRYPRSDIKKTIVRYTDYVQMHSAYLHIQEMKEPPIVVEVGAHHGIYAAVLGKLVQQMKGIFLAIEPDQDSFAILQKNIFMYCLTDTVRCVECAIMPNEQQYHLHAAGSESFISEKGNDTTVMVAGKPLQTVLNEYSLQKIDLLLIDVERAELHVLNSIDWKKTSVANIYCELHPYQWKEFGYDGAAMITFLVQHRFRCFDMYMQEQTNFTAMDYIGPTVFFPAEGRENCVVRKTVRSPKGGLKRKPKKRDT